MLSVKLNAKGSGKTQSPIQVSLGNVMQEDHHSADSSGVYRATTTAQKTCTHEHTLTVDLAYTRPKMSLVHIWGKKERTV